MRELRRRALGASSLALLVLASVAGGGSAVIADEQQPPVRIGSDDFYESRLMAEIWAQALEGQGFTVERQLGLGTRLDRVPTFQQGLVDLVPEYVGSGVGFFDPSKGSTDGETNARTLEQLYAAAGTPVTVLGLTPGQDANTGAVRADTAAASGLARMSDLAAVQDQLRWGLTPECDDNPFCRGALETYGISYPPAQVERLAACSDLMATALANGAIDFAWLCSTQPAIRQYGFVALEDDLKTQSAENLAPLVRNDWLDQVAGGADTVRAILDPVSARITTDVLLDLGIKVGVDQEDVADVAAAFLASIATDEQGTPAASASPAA